MPVLLLHHKRDGCVVTPYEAMPEVLAALKAARVTEFIGVEGGEQGQVSPCSGGYHQFLGIEESVTRTIAEWIGRNAPRK